jgi:hypothetical protein
MHPAALRGYASRPIGTVAAVLVCVGASRVCFATLPEPPQPEEVMSSYEPRLERALKRCAARAHKPSFGDVIIALSPPTDGPLRFELDVSRSLGTEIVKCLRAPFRRILTEAQAHMPRVSSDVYVLVTVGTPGAVPPVDRSFIKQWLGNARASSTKVPRSADIAVGEDGCLRLRGTWGFQDTYRAWLNRDAVPVHEDWSDLVAKAFAIPPGEFFGAWTPRPGTLLLWSAGPEPSYSYPPSRLCAVRSNDTAFGGLAADVVASAACKEGDLFAQLVRPRAQRCGN